MVIGIPKEIMTGEKRVSATPETCELFIKDGHKVIVEQGAGLGSLYMDNDYKASGAELTNDVVRLYQQADVILKVKEPQQNNTLNKHEIDLMHEGQYLITFIHPAAPANHEMVARLAKQGIIALTLDGVPRISRAQNMDSLTAMSTCAGYKGMIMAADILPKFVPQIFTAAGMIQPVHALVVGVGVAGLQAIATAKRLGAVTHAMDIRPAAAEQGMSLGAKVIELPFPPSQTVGEGGYALALPNELLQKEKQILSEYMKTMDIVFLSALVPGKLAPILVDEEMVKSMKPGSVIVDISIDQGGNCGITTPAETVTKHDVHIIGIKNIPGMLPTSATWMFAHTVRNIVQFLVKDGSIVLDLDDEIVQGMLTTNQGQIVHKGAREAMGL